MEEGTKIKDFTDLYTWQSAHKLAIAVYRITKSFPKEELYGLTSQMRRAAVSVTSNIAEGFERQNQKEKIQFYYLAQGSLAELKNQLILSKDVDYINLHQQQVIMDLLDESFRLLKGLIRKSKVFLR